MNEDFRVLESVSIRSPGSDYVAAVMAVSVFTGMRQN